MTDNQKNIGRFKYFPPRTVETGDDRWTTYAARLLDTATGAVYWAGEEGKWKKDMDQLSPEERRP